MKAQKTLLALSQHLWGKKRFLKYVLTIIFSLDFIQKRVNKKFEEVGYKFKYTLTMFAEVSAKISSYTPKENYY